MLVWFANPRSATAALIQMCNADRNALDLSRSTQMISPTAPCSPAATPSNKALYRVPASQTPRPLRSNPHSAAHPPFPHRGFFPWRISYAGPGARGTVRNGRHPKSFTKPEILKASKSFPLFLESRRWPSELSCRLFSDTVYRGRGSLGKDFKHDMSD
jgi:hypothetical protein